MAVVQGQSASTITARQLDHPRLLAVLPRGEAIRNFVYGGVLDRFAQEGEVAVLSVAPSAETGFHNLSRLRRRTYTFGEPP